MDPESALSGASPETSPPANAHGVQQPDRLDAYQHAVADAGAVAFVLTSEPAVQHAFGVRLYSQRLIPQRPVACVVTADGRRAIVCCEVEADQMRAEHPDSDIIPFREFGDDPWVHVARAVASSGRVIVEGSMPAPWVSALEDQLGAGTIVANDAAIGRPREHKTTAELDVFAASCAAAERALAAGALMVAPGVTERAVAHRIITSFVSELPGRVSEITAMAIAPEHNRSMHHVPSLMEFGTPGLVRLGVIGRVDGYWLIITRMMLLGVDSAGEEAYARYLSVYESGIGALQPGARCADVYEHCRQAAADHGFALTTLKVAHGTGLDFREAPIVSPHSADRLEPGNVLAYDYGLEAADGTVLHVEDRVAIGPSGPRRISAAWDLADLRSAAEGVLA